MAFIAIPFLLFEMKILLSFVLLLSVHWTVGQTWLSLNGGLYCDEDASPLVYEIEYDEVNNLLLAAGNFHHDLMCNEMHAFANWNGAYWTTFPEGCAYDVRSVEIYNNEVYALEYMECGNYNEYLYKLADGNWVAIDNGPNQSWYELEVIDDKLYGGGGFDSIGDLAAEILFDYDGNEFTPLVTENLEDIDVTVITSIVEYYDTLYVGGSFQCNECTATNRLKKLAQVYESEIHQVGVGLNSFAIVEAMCVHRDTLFIGGNFNSSNFPDFTNEEYIFLLTYANGELKPYPVQPNIRVTGLKSYNDLLFVGGWFNEVDGETNTSVFALDGTEVITLSTDTFYNSIGDVVNYGGGQVRDLEIYDDTLYIAGGWQYIGDSDTPYGGVAKLNLSLSSLVAVGESEETITEVALCPNPSSQLQINLTSKQSNDTEIVIYDLSGRLLSTSKYQSHRGINRIEVETNNLSAGTYLVSVRTADWHHTLRWVKE